MTMDTKHKAGERKARTPEENMAAGFPLAEEIGADVWAPSPMEMVETLVEDAGRRAHALQRTVGRTRRKRNAA